TATTNPAGLSVSFTYNGSQTPPTNAGSYTVVGTINDANYQGSATGTLTINQAATATAVSSSVNPSDFGQNVTFTAKVTSNAGIPPGSVQFKDGGINLGSPVTLDASGTATFSTSLLTPGTHN